MHTKFSTKIKGACIGSLHAKLRGKLELQISLGKVKTVPAHRKSQQKFRVHCAYGVAPGIHGLDCNAVVNFRLECKIGKPERKTDPVSKKKVHITTAGDRKFWLHNRKIPNRHLYAVLFSKNVERHTVLKGKHRTKITGSVIGMSVDNIAALPGDSIANDHGHLLGECPCGKQRDRNQKNKNSLPHVNTPGTQTMHQSAQTNCIPFPIFFEPLFKENRSSFFLCP